MWVQLRSYTGYFAKNMVLAMLFGDKFWLPKFPDLRRQFNDSVMVRLVCSFSIRWSFVTFASCASPEGERPLEHWQHGFFPSVRLTETFSRICSRKCHRPDTGVSMFRIWMNYCFKSLTISLNRAHKSICDAAASTCCRACRPRAHRGLADANAIVSLWTNGWHNRCVNTTSIQPVGCVWLA